MIRCLLLLVLLVSGCYRQPTVEVYTRSDKPTWQERQALERKEYPILLQFQRGDSVETDWERCKIQPDPFNQGRTLCQTEVTNWNFVLHEDGTATPNNSHFKNVIWVRNEEFSQ